MLHETCHIIFIPLFERISKDQEYLKIRIAEILNAQWKNLNAIFYLFTEVLKNPLVRFIEIYINW